MRICTLFFILWWSTSLPAQVILSEVMFDPLGSDAHDEFVEVFNISDHQVALEDWRVSDGAGEDVIISFVQGTTLLPGQYGLILDNSYFTNSTLYDSSIPDSCIVMTIDNATFGSRGLSNSSTEEVSLINPEGVTVARYRYSLDNPPGISDEKIELTADDSAGNWANSLRVHGSPGAPNTNRRLDFDLRIDQASLQVQPPRIQFGDEATILAVIVNAGTKDVQTFSLELIVEGETDGEVVAEHEFGALSAGDSARITIPYQPAIAGIHTLLLVVEPMDGNGDNNKATLQVPVGVHDGDVLISEIMYSTFDNEPEWIEVLNVAAYQVDLKGWSIMDSRSRSDSLEFTFQLAPDRFAIFAESQLPAGESIVLSSWPALNNDAERIALLDATGNEIDAVPYQATWGGDRGVSLERISYHSPSDDQRGWTSSVAVAGGTPGEVNSVFAETVPTSLSLDLSPNPFSPDGDGRDDFVVLTYNLPSTTADIRIQVYDLRGRLISELVNSAPSGAHGTVIWDGMDQNGNKARIGIYVVFLQALNATEGVLVTARKTVVVATHL